MDVSQFTTCVDSEKYKDKIQSDTTAGIAAGVSGTPTFYINGQELVGAVPYAQLKAVIESKLSE